MSGCPTQSSVFPDIQGLRAVAVLLVILYHAAVPGLAGGYVGVDVFFVISGYLIGGLLVRERQRTGRIRFVEFYARRARRLLPAAFAAILGALVVSRLVLAPMEQPDVTASALGAALYVSNFLFAWRSTDYLSGQSAADPLLHTWSLAVEEQFYLVWPALVMIAALGVSNDKLQRRLAAAFVVASIASLIACVWLTRSHQPWAFFGMPARAWEFGLGALAYLYCSRGDEVSRAVREALGLAGVALIGAAAVTLDRQTSFPGLVALLPSVGTAMAIVAGRGERPAAVSRLLSIAPLRWLGDISYSLYLWHWPALVATVVLGTGFLGKALGLTLAVLVAQASYLWLENPIRHSQALARRPVPSLVGALTLTIALAATTLGVRLVANVDMTAGGQWSYAEARGDLPIVYARRCNAEYLEVQLGDCAFAHVESRREIVLYGDSHAAHWFPALEVVADTLDARLVSLTKSGCPSVEVPILALGRQGRSFECDEWRANMVARIVDDRPALVVIANYGRNIGIGPDDRPTQTSPLAWRDGLESLLTRLQSARIPVLIIQDNPLAPMDVPVCLSRAAWRGEAPAECRFEVTTALRRVQPLFEQERALAEVFPDVSFLDMTGPICDADPCLVLAGGMPRYRDKHHLTASFSRTLAPHIIEHLETQALLKPGSRLDELVR